jgi:hypothetical protein
MRKLSEKLKTVKFRLSEAGNTVNPALLILQSKGYEIGFEQGEGEDGGETWWAEKDDNLFTASDGLSLLGLVSIWENRGNNWQTKENETFLWEDLRNEIYSN